MDANRPPTPKQEMALDLIERACQLLGWHVILPETDDISFIILTSPEAEEGLYIRFNGEFDA